MSDTETPVLNLHEVPTFRYETRSFSQFSTYAQCSEKYRLQKVEKVPEDMTAWAPQGNAVHTGIESWELSGRAMDVEEAVRLAVEEYDRLIAEQWRKQPEESGWLTGGRTRVSVDIERRRERVEKQTRGYIDYSLTHEHMFRPATLPDGKPAVEVPFSIKVNGVIIRGAIDLILEWHDGKITLRDTKTGNKLPNDPLQLKVYQMAWEQYFGDHIEYGDFYMCKNDWPTDPYYLDDIPEGVVGAWVEMMHRSERSGIYLPNGGDHCRVCTVRKYCPLMGSNEKQAYLMPTMKTEVDYE